MQLLFPTLRRKRLFLRRAFACAVAGATGFGAAAAGQDAPTKNRPERNAVVRLSAFAETHKFEIQDRESETVLSRGNFSLVFQPDSRRARIRDVLVWLQRPLRRPNGFLELAKVDAKRVLDPILRPYRHVRRRPVRTIVLDPGHGGDDGGAVGPAGETEKEATLDIAKRLQTRLESEGFRVHLTRDEDLFLPLEDRARRAEALHADVFVSIHMNGWTQPDVEGIETYVLSKPGHPSTNSAGPACSLALSARTGNRHDGANLVLGFALQRRMLQQTGAVDRGLRHARFQVLREAPCPAALVECGFITHPEESARIRDGSYRDDLAEGLAQGLLEYVRHVERARLASW